MQCNDNIIFSALSARNVSLIICSTYTRCCTIDIVVGYVFFRSGSCFIQKSTRPVSWALFFQDCITEEFIRLLSTQCALSIMKRFCFFFGIFLFLFIYFAILQRYNLKVTAIHLVFCCSPSLKSISSGWCWIGFSHINKHIWRHIRSLWILYFPSL